VPVSEIYIIMINIDCVVWGRGEVDVSPRKVNFAGEALSPLSENHE